MDAPAVAKTPVFRVEGLTTGYTDVPLIHDIHLNLCRHEIVGLLGANGAGKTTAMRAAVGLLPVWNGIVLFEETNITNMPAHERVKLGLAFVSSGRTLFSGMTVKENLMMGSYLNWSAQAITEGMKHAFALFPELIEHSSQLAGKLSGGEQQMCKIACALMCKPKVLIIDEFSSGLAPLVADRLMKAIEQIRSQAGVAIMFVEQDVIRATTLADRVYVLDQGQVVLEGHPRTVVRDKEMIRSYLGTGIDVTRSLDDTAI